MKFFLIILGMFVYILISNNGKALASDKSGHIILAAFADEYTAEDLDNEEGDNSKNEKGFDEQHDKNWRQTTSGDGDDKKSADDEDDE